MRWKVEVYFVREDFCQENPYRACFHISYLQCGIPDIAFIVFSFILPDKNATIETLVFSNHITLSQKKLGYTDVMISKQLHVFNCSKGSLTITQLLKRNLKLLKTTFYSLIFPIT